MKMMKSEAVKNHRAGQGGVGEHSVIVMLLSSESRNQTQLMISLFKDQEKIAEVRRRFVNERFPSLSHLLFLCGAILHGASRFSEYHHLSDIDLNCGRYEHLSRSMSPKRSAGTSSFTKKKPSRIRRPPPLFPPTTPQINNNISLPSQDQSLPPTHHIHVPTSRRTTPQP